MTKDFSSDPIEGEEARKIRKMHHEWDTFQETDMEALKKVAWAIRNWKFIGLMLIIGAAGSFKNVLETAKAWIS